VRPRDQKIFFKGIRKRGKGGGWVPITGIDKKSKTVFNGAACGNKRGTRERKKGIRKGGTWEVSRRGDILYHKIKKGENIT